MNKIRPSITDLERLQDVWFDQHRTNISECVRGVRAFLLLVESSRGRPLTLTRTLTALPTAVALRNRVNLAAAYCLLNRGDNRRSMLLRDLGLVVARPDGSPSEREVLLVVYPNTKTTRKPEVTGALRNASPHLCLVGNLAFFCFYRFDILVR